MKIILKIMISLVSGGAITALTTVPFISMIIGLAAFPVLNIPGFESTGKHVEYGFMWVTLKSIESWILLISYFSIIIFIILISFFKN
ncbi:hypothetical protein [Halanaerobium praevalens]|uniref:Uncharacterized protein n=1 Tax=Halanaerobium praevalens (strain ATCC 33744 / DSM 2228 / GSL) TaxID=572479 RepID=E3DN79_HALPG|nr:hypothetical protein [Halanaerobium praevalens]ADO77498.1 hypothetical protein Hprae_1365 [Halanaerobium praevalens DSM 2228]